MDSNFKKTRESDMTFKIEGKERIYRSKISPIHEIYQLNDLFFLTMYDNKEYNVKVSTRDRKYVFEKMSRIEDVYKMIFEIKEDKKEVK